MGAYRVKDFRPCGCTRGHREHACAGWILLVVDETSNRDRVPNRRVPTGDGSKAIWQIRGPIRVRNGCGI